MSKERVLLLLSNNDTTTAKSMLMEDLKIDYEEASKIIEQYYERCNGIFGEDIANRFVDLEYNEYDFHNSLDSIRSLEKEGRIPEAIEETESFCSRHVEGYLLNALLHYVHNLDVERGIGICSEGIEDPRNNDAEDDEIDEDVEDLRFYRYKFYLIQYSDSKGINVESLLKARRDCLHILQNGDNEWTIPLGFSNDDVHNMLDIVRKDIKKIEAECVKCFPRIPYKERKLLCVVKDYPKADIEHIYVVKKDFLPELQFGLEGASTNQLYVGNPYVPNIYIPFERYQQELIEEKLRELCEVAQCLGATKITIEAVNSSSTEKTRDQERNIGGGVEIKGYGLDASQRKESSSRLLEEISKSINIYQEFSPNRPPFLPDNLLFYPMEPSWQRLYNQRMMGQIVHDVRMETSKNQVVGNSELNEIKGEFIAIVASANGSWSKRTEECFTQQENAILSIKIEFAPLSMFTQDGRTVLAQTLTTSEQEYLDEFKEYAADGEISERDRKMLDKFRSRCGISEERARELEASCNKPQLTEDEQEYLEMYKEYAADGEISERDRKMLNKMRDRMGISEERAKEIENISK